MDVLSNNKIVIISGATGYVGSAAAKKLAEAGFRIAVLYNHAPEGEANKLLATLPGEQHLAYKCNLNSAQEVFGLVEKILKDKTKNEIIYGCVHCAWTKPKRKQQDNWIVEDVMDQLNENLPSSFNLISACAKLFKQQRNGVIVCVTTAAIFNPKAGENLAGYVPAKQALQGLLSLYRNELLGFGVGVYSVAPGFMAGGMNSDIPKAFVEMIKQKSPGQKLVTAEEVAEKIAQLFMLKDHSQTEFTHLLAPHAV